MLTSTDDEDELQIEISRTSYDAFQHFYFTWLLFLMDLVFVWLLFNGVSSKFVYVVFLMSKENFSRVRFLFVTDFRIH